MHHIESIMYGQNEAWQNIALFFGFQEWQVGAGEGGKKAKQRKLDKKGLIKPKGRRGSKKTQAEVDAIIEKLRLQK